MGKKLITMPDPLLTSLREYEKDHPEFNFSGFVQKQTAEFLRTVPAQLNQPRV